MVQKSYEPYNESMADWADFRGQVQKSYSEVLIKIHNFFMSTSHLLFVQFYVINDPQVDFFLLFWKKYIFTYHLFSN